MKNWVILEMSHQKLEYVNRLFNMFTPNCFKKSCFDSTTKIDYLHLLNLGLQKSPIRARSKRNKFLRKINFVNFQNIRIFMHSYYRSVNSDLTSSG